MNEVFGNATRGVAVFRAGDRLDGRLPQTRRKINIHPPVPFPHAELAPKLNTAHPFPYYVTRKEGDDDTSERTSFKQPSRARQ